VTASSGLFGREIYTPTKLAARVQESFDQEIGSVWVEGEISELSLPPSGHAYFCLKDGQSRLKAVMWKGRRSYAGSALSEGLTVLARGRLAVYAPRGEFQLVADYLEPRGEGALRLAFEKLKAQLEREGLFDPGRKRPLPFWPRRVAVVSSPVGAAVRDFIQTARARMPGADICLYPVRVQGDGAAAEIAEALADLNAWGGFDLIVITRGGGSLSDLWAFNEEAVVRAVAASRTPTLAAIGHSTDLSLAELAADHRAITPTAAAEAVFRDRAALLHHVDGLRAALARSLYGMLELRRERLEAARRRLSRGLTGALLDRRYRFEYLLQRLERFEGRLERDRQHLLALHDRLGRAMRGRLAAQAHRLEKAAVRLHDLSPENVLRRGYALVTRGPGAKPVASAASLAVGEEVSVRLADGAFTSVITNIESRS
jgi:exodeoxyribonuclease VII large subunit